MVVLKALAAVPATEFASAAEFDDTGQLFALHALGWLQWCGIGHVKVTQNGRLALEKWQDPYDAELAAGLAALRGASELLHEAAVLPALKVLTAPRFQGAQAEFRNAVVHAARGEGSQALTEACKALESVMKVILSDHGFPSNGSARELIGELKSHDLLGAAHDDDVAVGIEKVLLQLPKVRNKHGGHGAGRTARVVPPHVVAFGLHLAAANIVYLAACG